MICYCLKNKTFIIYTSIRLSQKPRRISSICWYRFCFEKSVSSGIIGKEVNMTIELTNEEKLGIVNQHIKSVDYGLYGLQLDLLEIQATANADAGQVSNINTRIAAATAKRAALVEERDSLTPEVTE